MSNNESNYIVSHIIESICIIGPNVFVAISAYFMIGVQKIQIRKIVNLYAQIVFWALLFYVFTVAVIGVNDFSFKETALIFVPFLGGRRWFVETYMLLMLFAPFMNVLIKKIDKRSYLIFIVIWILIYSIWPSFLPSAPITDNGYGLTNFVTIYLIVGYIRLYVDPNVLTKKRTLILLIGVTSTVFVAMMSILPGMLGGDNVITKLCDNHWNYDYIFNIIAAISLFLLFLTVKLKSSKIINFIAETTFGVFLIHSDFSLWKVLYQDILHCNVVYHSVLFIPHLLVSVVAMFVCSSLLEVGRKKIWGVTVDKVLDHCKVLNKEIEVKINEGY